MNITFDTSSYNERRYGKPYIATIDFTDPKGTPTWGDWVGQAGDAGLLSIEAQVGDVIMRGQKDGRGTNPPSYYIVRAEGAVHCDTKADAYREWKAFRAAKVNAPNPLAAYTIEQLQAEIARRAEAA